MVDSGSANFNSHIFDSCSLVKFNYGFPVVASTSYSTPGQSSASGQGFETNIPFDNKALGVSFVETSAVGGSTKLSGQAFEAYLDEFKRTARGDFLEYGEYGRCDELMERWSKDDSLPLGSVINYIFTKSIKDKRISLFLLKSISSLSYDEIGPSGPVQAMAYLSLEDDELAEAGIRAFESWEHPDGIALLEAVDMRSAWLNKYRLKTIEYLKGL